MRTAAWLAIALAASAAQAESFARKSCLDCHQTFAEKLSKLKDVHAPVRAQKCEDCHLRHGLVPKLILKEQGNQLCAGCHKAQAARQHVPKGKCADCHDPHGTDTKALLTKDCFSCHAKGPFQRKNVHPVDASAARSKDGACATCHAVHGSAQKALLVAPEGQLCAKCHAAPKHGGFAVSTRCSDCHEPHSSDGPLLLKAVQHRDLSNCAACHGPSLSLKAKCADCHRARAEDLQAHARTACTGCHVPHASAEKGLLKPGGDAFCVACHEKKKQAFTARHGPSCADCHRSHGGQGKALLVAAAPGGDGRVNQLCAKCHEAQVADELKDPSVHAPFKAGNCSACHDPHGSNVAGMLKAPEDKLCYGCHAAAETSFARSHTHKPVQDGQCGACHQGHSSSQSRLLKASGAALCSTCHAPRPGAVSKHAPFAEGQCLTCHDPHGSNIAGMLVADQSNLCVRCHGKETARVEAAKSKHEPFVKGQCTACHSAHEAALPKLRLAAGPDGCLTCHAQIKEQLATQTVHAPAAADCLGCHAPHASGLPALTSVREPELCVRCHAADAKFGQAHLGSDVSRCTTCHDPHAGKDRRLLSRVAHAPFEQGKCGVCHVAGGNL